MGRFTASISTSLIASLIASLITLNLGVGCAPSCWPIFWFPNLLGGLQGPRGECFPRSPGGRFSDRGGEAAELGCLGASRRRRFPGFLNRFLPLSHSPSSDPCLRRAEAASAVWIPHWHSEPFESQGTRAAKRYVNGSLVEREKHHLNLHLHLHLDRAESCSPIF